METNGLSQPVQTISPQKEGHPLSAHFARTIGLQRLCRFSVSKQITAGSCEGGPRAVRRTLPNRYFLRFHRKMSRTLRRLQDAGIVVQPATIVTSRSLPGRSRVRAI